MYFLNKWMQKMPFLINKSDLYILKIQLNLGNNAGVVIGQHGTHSSHGSGLVCACVHVYRWT